MEDFLKKTIVIFLLCVVIYLIVVVGKRLDWYLWIDILQNLYIEFGNVWGAKMASVINEKTRKRLQELCFFVIFILMIIMDATYGGSYLGIARYWIFGQGLLLIFAGVLSWKETLKKLEWRNGFCFSWTLLWVLVCVSDLLVQKSFSYVGYIMLFCAGFAFFVWQNAGCFSQVLRRMLRGLEWTFLPVILYCMICRQKKEGIQYNGCFAQPENMAMYALVLLIAFLAEIDILLRKNEIRKVQFLVKGVGVVLSGFFLYYSRVTWCLLAAAVVIFIWLGMQLLHFSRLWGKMRVLLGLGILVLLAGGALTLGIKYGIQTLPDRLGTSIIYKGEVQKTYLPEEIMYALEAEQPGWIEGVIRETAVERQDARRDYVQGLNLLGNKDNISTDGVYLNLASGVLQMAHRYGMFILVPYLVMWTIGIASAVREKRFWWIAIIAALGLGILGGNLEMPFTQPLWFMAYIGLGQMFGNQEKEYEVKKYL